MIINKNNKLHPTYKNFFIYKEKEYQSLLNCIESNLNEKEKVIFKYFHNNYENLLLLVDKRIKNYIIEDDMYNLGSIYFSLHHYFYTLKHFKEIREIKTLTLENMINEDYNNLYCY